MSINANLSILALLAATVLAADPAQSRDVPAVQASDPVVSPGLPSYADLADLVLASPVIVDATIRSTTRIKGAEAAGVATGSTRLYVEADVAALVRGPQGSPTRVGYILDVPPDAGGRLPKLKKRRVLLFARPVPATLDQLQLAATDAQLAWTPELDARVRGIVRETVAADAAPLVTGVGNAFHVAGALPGEGETQIFLLAADGRPVSLSILRRPGEQPRFAVALSEIVDEAAGPPRRDTLLWYRLACGLPPTLPETSTASLGAEDARVASEDYRFVVDRLGPCGRTRISRLPAPAPSSTTPTPDN